MATKRALPLLFLVLLLPLFSGCAFAVSALGTAIGGLAKDKATEYFLHHGVAEIEVEFYPNIEETQIEKICESVGTMVLAKNPSENKYFVKVLGKRDVDETLKEFLDKRPEGFVKNARRYTLEIKQQKILKK